MTLSEVEGSEVLMRSRGGFVYITTLLLFISASLLAIVSLSRSITELTAAERTIDLQQALHLADAGLDETLAEFTTGGADGDTTFSADEGWSGASCGAGGPCTNTFSFSGGTASVTVDDIDGNPATITVTGTADGVSQTVEMVIEPPATSVFQFALFGEEGIDLDRDILVDSYDSTLGAYTPSPATGNRSNNGDIATNSTTADTMTLDQDLTIDGDVLVGSGGDPDTVINASQGVTVTGVQDAQSSNFELPAIEVPAGTACGDALEVDPGETVTMSVDGFCYSSITVNGNARRGSGKLILTGDGQITLASETTTDLNVAALASIEIQGDVTLVAGEVEINNSLELGASASLELYATDSVFLKGVVNNTEDPRRLAINYTGTATLTAGQSTDFYGTIYAPDAEVLLHQSGDFFGSVVAKQVSVDQAGQFHFDESLADEESESSEQTVTIRSWRQP